MSHKDYIYNKYILEISSILSKYIKKNKNLNINYFKNIEITNENNNNYLIYINYKYPANIKEYIGFIELINSKKLKLKIINNSIDLNIINKLHNELNKINL
tara:strand:- start:49 stop:351 length:303 start_codon:yes stop_codon:yes gene_type:complete